MPLKMEVVRWKTGAGRDVSDHYGLDATLELRERPRAEADGISARKSLAPLKARLDELSAASGAVFSK